MDMIHTRQVSFSYCPCDLSLICLEEKVEERLVKVKEDCFPN